jgi:kynurenine formamidase
MATDLERWKRELSNWGRWGKDDEIGAPQSDYAGQADAGRCVGERGRVGFVVPSRGPGEGRQRSVSVRAHDDGIGGDVLNIRLHGYAHTHLDSMAHVYDGGKGYNGYTPEERRVMKEGGHAKNSVYGVHTGIFTRGILIGIPRLKGVPYLEPGAHIYPEDLEAWEKRAGVKVSAGDALFIRTGRWTRRERVGPWEITNMAGLDASCLPWLRQRDIALLSGESPQDAVPVLGDLTGLPVHNFVLIYLGVQLIDNASLDAAAEAAAARNRWEFLFTTAPFALRGGTGSPSIPSPHSDRCHPCEVGGSNRV